MGNDRRYDIRTSTLIRDVLRVQGVQPAAMALAHLGVRIEIARRVLAAPRRRRGR
jgi:hypothetical protein